jgi:hypothetical protein
MMIAASCIRVEATKSNALGCPWSAGGCFAISVNVWLA